jgi:hypothetical protein
VSGTATITHIFSFSGLQADLPTTPVADAVDLGRFEKHVRNRPDQDVQVLPLGQIDDVVVASTDVDLVLTSPTVQVWTEGTGLVQLHLTHETSDAAEEVCRTLSILCHQRDQLTMSGRSLSDWVAELAGIPPTLSLRQDVLQLVSVDRAALARFEGPSHEALGVLYRDPGGTYDTLGTIRVPSALNRAGKTFLAHGRGVVLMCGHSRERQNTLRMTASEQLFALARARRARASIEAQLRSAQDHPSLSGPWKDTAFLTELADDVRRQRVVLSLDVRAFADGMFMPELIIDDFRASFAASLRLDEVTDSSVYLVDTLADVVQSYLEEAKLLASGLEAARQRRWQLVVGVASGIAIPIALLLSYFGVSSAITAPGDRSIFDLGFYVGPWTVTASVTVLVVLLSLRQHRASRPR